MKTTCFNCKEEGEAFYGYTICNNCKKNLRLFSDSTVERHVLKHSKAVYQSEIKERIDFMEKDFIKKKIKLLDILTKTEK